MDLEHRHRATETAVMELGVAHDRCAREPRATEGAPELDPEPYKVVQVIETI